MTELQAAQNTMASLIESGFTRALAVRTARMGWDWAKWPRSLPAMVASAALGAAWPVLLELVLLATYGRYALHTMRAVSWVLALSLLDLVALLCAWRTWVLLSRAGTSLDELIGNSAARDRLTRSFAGTFSRPRQITVSVICVVAGCLLLRLVQSSIENELEMGPMSYVAVGWTAALAGNCAYWLVVIPELARRILRQPDVTLIWHSPASTPGIVHLSSGFGFCTLSALGVAVGLDVLALRASRYGDSEVLAVLSATFPVIAGLAALTVGILPHWWLYLTVRDARRRALATLRPLTGDAAPITAEQVARAHAQVELYRLVETSPGLPFSTASMVQYAAAVLGTLVAFFLGR